MPEVWPSLPTFAKPCHWSARGALAPAILVVVVAAHVVVETALRGGAHRCLGAVRSEGAAGQFDLAGGRALAAARHQVDRPAERVAAQQRAVAGKDLDPLHVLHRQEVEVDLGGIRFVDPHAVHEHRDALRRSHHGRRVEAAGAHVDLVGRAEVVVGGHARLLPQDIGQDLGFRGVDLAPVELGRNAGDAGADLDARQGKDRPDHLDGRQHVRTVGLRAVGNLRAGVGANETAAIRAGAATRRRRAMNVPAGVDGTDPTGAARLHHGDAAHRSRRERSIRQLRS